MNEELRKHCEKEIKELLDEKLIRTTNLGVVQLFMIIRMQN